MRIELHDGKGDLVAIRHLPEGTPPDVHVHEGVRYALRGTRLNGHHDYDPAPVRPTNKAKAPAAEAPVEAAVEAPRVKRTED